MSLGPGLRAERVEGAIGLTDESTSMRPMSQRPE